MCYTSWVRVTVADAICRTPIARRRWFAPVCRAFRARTSGGPAVAVSYALVGAILLFGGLGYALDARFGTAPTFVAIGLLLGVALGLYQLAKWLWRR